MRRKKEHVYEQCTWQQKHFCVRNRDTSCGLAAARPCFQNPVSRCFHATTSAQPLVFYTSWKIFREEQCKHNTTSYLKPFPFLINFISCRKKKSDGQAQKSLGMQVRNSFANILFSATSFGRVFFFLPFCL